MPTNSKEYIKNYMKKYNLTDKNREYKMSYYEKNKEHLQTLQRKYYHEHKNNPEKSHYLEKRLKLQRDRYKEVKPESKVYNISRFKKEKHFPIIRFNYGNWSIDF